MKLKFIFGWMILIIYFSQVVFIMLILTKNIFSISISWSLMKIYWLNFEMLFNFDQMSYIFSLTVNYISVCVLTFSNFYMSMDKHYLYFHSLILLFIFSMLLLIFSQNSLSMMLGWDMLGISSYLLVLYYNNSLSANCAMTTVLSNRVGDLFLIILLSLLFSLGSLNMSMNKFSFEFIFFSLLILFAGCTKSAQIPFSAWLPLAMIAPTPVSALVHSSTLVTAGLYIMIRHFLNIILWMGCNYLFIMGSLTMIMASMSALYEMDVKKIVALSTLSQLGVMSLSLGMELPLMAFLHLLIHAYFKAMMFIIVGQLIYFSLGYQAMTFMGGLGMSSPVMTGGFLIGGFSLMGMPYMAAFYSKEPIMEMLFMSNFLLTGYFLMLSGISLTCLYSLRLLLLSGIFLVRHNSILHIMESMKSIFSIFLLLLPSFFSGVIFSNFFCYLSFEGFMNSKVKMAICIFIFLSFFPISNLYFVEKKVLFFPKNFFFPWVNSYMGLMNFTSSIFNFFYLKMSKLLYFISTSIMNYNMKNMGPNKFYFKEKIFFLESTNLSKNLSFLFLSMFMINLMSF